MIRYQVEQLVGANNWQVVSDHSFFSSALDGYCDLEEQGLEVRIMCTVNKYFQVL